MTLWEHIKADAGFGVFDWLRGKWQPSYKVGESWWFPPLFMVFAVVLLFLVVTPINIVALCVGLVMSTWAWFCAIIAGYWEVLNKRDLRPLEVRFIGLLGAILLTVVISWLCT